VEAAAIFMGERTVGAVKLVFVMAVTVFLRQVEVPDL
jgi:hypothetical protein